MPQLHLQQFQSDFKAELDWVGVFIGSTGVEGYFRLQVIARIHHGQAVVRRLIHSLLICIGRHHPQALMYPLLVACKSQSSLRRSAALGVVNNVRSHSPTLVEQAQLVSPFCLAWWCRACVSTALPLLCHSPTCYGSRKSETRQNSPDVMLPVQVSTELIRMAILWHEMWHEALEEASRQYFGESNVEAMLATLMPLHEMMARNGPTTLKEIAFVQVYVSSANSFSLDPSCIDTAHGFGLSACSWNPKRKVQGVAQAYGRELQEAYDWCQRYKVSRRDAELHQAWDLYYHVFKRINKQLPSLTVLELQYVAPALVRAQVRVLLTAVWCHPLERRQPLPSYRQLGS